MPPEWRTYTVADFKIGQQVWVFADQSFRHGVVTKLGRTRVSVRHPRNRFGTEVERPYPMDRIVAGQGEHPDRWPRWGWVTGSGEWYGLGRTQPHPSLPFVQPMGIEAT